MDELSDVDKVTWFLTADIRTPRDVIRSRSYYELSMVEKNGERGEVSKIKHLKNLNCKPFFFFLEKLRIDLKFLIN